MREGFEGYFPPSREQLDAMWQSAKIVLDTSVVLGLYRYRPEVRENLLEVLERNSQRLLMPHQVAREIHRNRHVVRRQQLDAHSSLGKDVQKALNALLAAFQTVRHHPHIDAERLIQELADFENAVSEHLRESEAEHRKEYDQGADPLYDRIVALFEDRTIPAAEVSLLQERQAEVRRRFQRQIPPGYADAAGSKSGDHEIGDGLFWLELLDQADSLKHGLILVTDDLKDDWWLRVGSSLVGPRPELITEMLQRGCRGYLQYSSERFIEIARDRGLGVDEATVVAVQHAAEDRRAEADHYAVLADEALTVVRQHALADRIAEGLAASEGNREAMRELTSSVKVDPATVAAVQAIVNAAKDIRLGGQAFERFLEDEA